MLYILIRTDGDVITTSRYSTLEKAKEAMVSEYVSLLPSTNGLKPCDVEKSNIEEADAHLCFGDNRYLWKIEIISC